MYVPPLAVVSSKHLEKLFSHHEVYTQPMNSATIIAVLYSSLYTSQGQLDVKSRLNRQRIGF